MQSGNVWATCSWSERRSGNVTGCSYCGACGESGNGCETLTFVVLLLLLYDQIEYSL
jgi:hypothetical protein